MAGSRYDLIAQENWQWLGPAYRGIDADLAAVEAAISAGGGSVTVPVVQAAINVQKADGSWPINKTAVDGVHAAGSAVVWYTRPAQNAPTATNGLAVGDIVDGTITAVSTTSVATAPTAQDVDGTASDTITLTKAVGVTFTVDGVDHTSDSFTGTTKVVAYTKGVNTTVTAKAEAGFSLTGTTSWALTFTNYVPPAAGGIVTTDTFSGTARTLPTGTGNNTDAVNGGSPLQITITGTAYITASNTLSLASAGASYRLANTMASSVFEAQITKLPTSSQLDFYPQASGSGLLKISILSGGSSRIWLSPASGADRNSGSDVYVQAGDIVRGTKNGTSFKYEIERGGTVVHTQNMTLTAAENFTPTASKFTALGTAIGAEIDNVKLSAG